MRRPFAHNRCLLHHGEQNQVLTKHWLEVWVLPECNDDRRTAATQAHDDNDDVNDVTP